MKDSKVLWIVVTLVLVVTFAYSLFFSTPTYKVTFASNGGTTVGSQNVKKNEVVTKPEDPVRDGYVFKGWQADGIDYDFDTKVSKAITIEAVWEEIPTIYKITFNSNSGSKVSDLEVLKGEKVTKPKKPTRKGYTFVEWQLDGKKYDFNTAVNEDLTLKAKWKKK